MTGWLVALLACRTSAPGGAATTKDASPWAHTAPTADTYAEPTPFTGRDCASEPEWVDRAGTVTIQLTEGSVWDTLSVEAHFHDNEIHDDGAEFEAVASDDTDDDCYWYKTVYDPEPHGEPVSSGVVTVTVGSSDYELHPYGNDHQYPNHVELDRDGDALAHLYGQSIHIEATGSADSPSFSFQDIDIVPSHRINLYEPAANAPVAPSDVVFRWDPGTTLDGRMEVRLSAGIPNTSMVCMVDDDGEWSPPSAIFDHMVDAGGVNATLRARQPCYKELSDGRFLRIWHLYEATGSAEIARDDE
jgi:hypothetical protein